MKREFGNSESGMDEYRWLTEDKIARYFGIPAVVLDAHKARRAIEDAQILALREAVFAEAERLQGEFDAHLAESDKET